MSRRHTGRRAASLLVAAVLILSVGAAWTGAHVAVARPVENDASNALVETAVANFHFEQPEYAQLPTNTTINVTFFNDDPGGATHTFTILNRSNWVIPSQWTNVSQLASQHGTLVNLTAGSQNTSYGSFVAPATGWYEFLCLIAGHFNLGMYGFIAFGEDLPSNLTVGAGSPGPGLAVFVIVGTIVALTVLALVLGFVFGRREGAVHEMPPERLGYAEPPPPPTGGVNPPRPDS